MTPTVLVRILLLPLVLLLLPLPSHAAEPFEPTPEDDPDLVAAWQAWTDKDIDDYSTVVTLSCFCAEIQPVRTHVRNGDVRKVVQGDRRLAARRGYSMDQLFAMIREAHADADRVEVTYTSRGVPKSIVVDEIALAADDERYYSVSLVRSPS